MKVSRSICVIQVLGKSVKFQKSGHRAGSFFQGFLFIFLGLFGDFWDSLLTTCMIALCSAPDFIPRKNPNKVCRIVIVNY